MILFYAPFYLVVRAGWYGSPIWSIPFLLIIPLFFYYLLKRFEGFYSGIKILNIMTLILIYYLLMIVVALISGSSTNGIAQKSWQHILPILFYFITFSLNYNFERINRTLQIVGFTSLAVAIFFLYEWMSVNLFGASSFNYSIKMNELGWIQDFYVAQGGQTIFNSINTKLRLGGPLMTMHNTSLFMIFGLIYFLGDYLFLKNKRSIIFLIICLTSSLLIFARTNIIMLVIAHLITYKVFTGKSMIVSNFKFIIPLSIGFSLLLIYASNIFELFSNFYNIFQILNIYDGPAKSIIDELILYLQFLSSNPFSIFIGRGFGDSIFLAADFGYASFHSMVGLFGIGLIIYFLINLIDGTKKKIAEIRRDLRLQKIYYVSYTIVLTSIFSMIHYTPLFHHGSYLAFFAILALISLMNDYDKKMTYFFTNSG